jgi:hypothetical protein
MTDRQTEAMAQFDRNWRVQQRCIAGIIICMALLGLCLAYLQGAG